MKYCPKCRVEYENWAKLCGDCQVELVSQLPEEAVNDEQDQNLVTVYTHLNESQIALVRTVLESEGIECFIKGVDRMRASIGFGLGGIGTGLQVSEKDRARAEEIIKEHNIK